MNIIQKALLSRFNIPDELNPKYEKFLADIDPVYILDVVEDMPGFTPVTEESIVRYIIRDHLLKLLDVSSGEIIPIIETFVGDLDEDTLNIIIELNPDKDLNRKKLKSDIRSILADDPEIQKISQILELPINIQFV